MGKYRFQFGGEDTGSTDFFNTLVDTYQRQTLPDYEQQDSENNNEDVNTEDNQNADYEDLLAKYQELEAKLADYSSSIQEQLPSMHDYGDNFLNFLFSDESNEPIDWSNVSRTPQATRVAQTSNKGFRTFGSYEEGKAALENQLKLYQTGKTRNPVKPNSTLLEAMSVYAPASDNNNPTKYAEFIAKKLGVSTLTPISQIDTKQWANAIEIMEGNKVGNNPGNLRPTRQFGGGRYKVASTPQEQYEGLNNPAFKQMTFPMKGMNKFRGLDSQQPVNLIDELGNQATLTSPSQTVKLFGTVREKRI